MNKFSLCLGAILSFALVSGVQAQEVDFYGKINLSYQYSDEDGDTERELKSNASRVGVQGGQKLSDELEVFFKLEWQVDVADLGGDDNLKSRNQYIGLKGSFGQIIAGRNDTMLKQSQGKVDLFNDYEADLKSRWKGENRLSETLTYITPEFDRFSAGVTYIIDDEVTGTSAFSYQLRYGDPSLKKTDWYASMAFDDDVKGVDVLRMIVSTKIADTVIGVGAQRQRLQDGDTDNGWLISAKRKWHKANLKLQLQSMDSDTSSSFGIDYPLAKNTKLYAWYTYGNEAQAVDNQWLALGMEYKF